MSIRTRVRKLETSIGIGGEGEHCRCLTVAPVRFTIIGHGESPPASTPCGKCGKARREVSFTLNIGERKPNGL